MFKSIVFKKVMDLIFNGWWLFLIVYGTWLLRGAILKGRKYFEYEGIIRNLKIEIAQHERRYQILFNKYEKELKKAKK